MQQQEAQAQQAAEAQADASAALAQAKKEAATILQEAQAKAAQMVQQQEAQAKQDVEATKQQVRILLMLDYSCCITCLAVDHHLERFHVRCLSRLISLVLHAVQSGVTSVTLHGSINITGRFDDTSRMLLICEMQKHKLNIVV